MVNALSAQSEKFVLYDQAEDVVESDMSKAETNEPEEIRVLERTWNLDLENYLMEKVIDLSSNQNPKKISKQDIDWIYKINQVPCKSGYQVVYLTLTTQKDFIVSLENPVLMDEVCGCFLDLKLPEKVIYSPKVYTTDDEERFGTQKATGKDKELPDVQVNAPF